MEKAKDFVVSLSDVLSDGMIKVFIAVVAVWLMVQGIKMILGRADLASLCREIFFVILAGGLLAGQRVDLAGEGSGLVITIYDMAIGSMTAAASTVLIAAGNVSGTDWTAGGTDHYSGVTLLVFASERGFMKVLDVGFELWKSLSVGNLTGPLTGVLIIIPWFLLIVVYFSQVMVTLFRVAVIAGLAPFVMLGVGFQWSQGMVWKGLKSLMAAGMVLYGSTLAIGICLYAVSSLEIHTGINPGSFFTSNGFLAVILGVMGTVFVTEATAVANSIAESQFTNTAAASMAGAAMGAGLYMAKKIGPPGLRQALNFADKATGAAQSGLDATRQVLFNDSAVNDLGKFGRGSSSGSFDDYLNTLRRGGVSKNG
ncbi:hypothetical protein [Thalassospira sp.]|uniref:hypothetical protein n=1 Tax=Thalassospira sp. TaxID=1912094 RepID=UPI0027335FDA|nr:hypothetical protein [Thalassospira sp.]MDP2699935.1 hypothetical protein [Thalassospira sp.]